MQASELITNASSESITNAASESIPNAEFKVVGKKVLELGAGVGLPGIIAVYCDAEKVFTLPKFIVTEMRGLIREVMIDCDIGLSGQGNPR